MNRTHPCVLTIGNFDGLHLGHRRLIQTVTKKASELGLSTRLITFEPHPTKILKPEEKPCQIFDLRDRISTAQELGIQNVDVIPFSRNLSELEPEDFFHQVVLDKFDAKFLVVGHDFFFGKNRRGNPELLKKLCAEKSIGLHVEPPFMIDGEVVSSSRIRKFLLEGMVDKAALFLGRRFYLQGIIQKGDGRGRNIGFPTANLFTQAELIPRNGVYVTVAEVEGKTLKSVTNIGDNPTFAKTENLKSKNSLKIETHILDFDRDIYGESLKINFVERLRDEKKFSNVAELAAQINLDAATARKREP